MNIITFHGFKDFQAYGISGFVILPKYICIGAMCTVSLFFKLAVRLRNEIGGLFLKILTEFLVFFVTLCPWGSLRFWRFLEYTYGMNTYGKFLEEFFDL